MSVETHRDREAGLQNLLQLRCQREIVERWIYTPGVPEPLQEQLRMMLASIEQDLQSIEMGKRPEAAVRLREAS